MPLGQGALGLGVSYALAVGYLLLMRFMGAILSRQYPEEHKVVWDTRTISRVTILAAVSGAGAMIKIPGPATTIALDAAAGYFAAAYFGWPIGATVAAIGCFLANALGGFASWLPMLPIYLCGMALTVTIGVLCRQKDQHCAGYRRRHDSYTSNVPGPVGNHDRHASDDCAASISDHWICG